MTVVTVVTSRGDHIGDFILEHGTPRPPDVIRLPNHAADLRVIRVGWEQASINGGYALIPTRIIVTLE